MSALLKLKDEFREIFSAIPVEELVTNLETIEAVTEIETILLNLE